MEAVVWIGIAVLVVLATMVGTASAGEGGSRRVSSARTNGTLVR
jgi:hypothetical protein